MLLEYLNQILPIIIYILLIILLVLLIIIILRAMKTVQKIDTVVENVNEKVNSLNTFFGIIDLTTDKLTIMGSRIIDLISNFISKVFKKNKDEKVKEEENNG